MTDGTVSAGVPGREVQDPGATAVVLPDPAAVSGFDVPVGADHEIDVSFVPGAPGRYPILDGGTQIAVLVVTPGAG